LIKNSEHHPFCLKLNRCADTAVYDGVSLELAPEKQGSGIYIAKVTKLTVKNKNGTITIKNLLTLEHSSNISSTSTTKETETLFLKKSVILDDAEFDIQKTCFMAFLGRRRVGYYAACKNVFLKNVPRSFPYCAKKNSKLI
jgi:hypothetical protein